MKQAAWKQAVWKCWQAISPEPGLPALSRLPSFRPLSFRFEGWSSLGGSAGQIGRRCSIFDGFAQDPEESGEQIDGKAEQGQTDDQTADEPWHGQLEEHGIADSHEAEQTAEKFVVEQTWVTEHPDGQHNTRQANGQV